MDKLDQLFEMQHELDQFVFKQHPEKLPESMGEWIIKLTIAMESELDEVRKEVPWKWWKEPEPINEENLHKEIIDLWHFLIAMSQRAGLSPDQIFEVYKEKREENFARQKGTSKEKDYRGNKGD